MVGRGAPRTRGPGTARGRTICDGPGHRLDVRDQPARRRERSAGRDRILTVPNVITLVRLACLPLFLCLLFGRDDRVGGRRRCSPRSAPPTGSTATSPGTSTRCPTLGKVLDPVADRLLFFVGDRRHPASTARCRRVVRVGRHRPRGGRGRRHVVLALLGRQAHRRHLVRQGRHVRPHVRLPAASWPVALHAVLAHARRRAGLGGRPSRAGAQLLRRRSYVPHRALPRRRPPRRPARPLDATVRARVDGPPGRFARREGRDHGRRRGHPAAAAHLERAQADDAAGQPADDGAHRRPAEAARLRRDRRHRRLPGQRHPHLLRRRLRVRRRAWSTPPRRRRSAPPARCATPWTSSTSASSSSPATCSPTSTFGASSRFHDEHEAHGHHRPRRTSRTRSSSASSSPTRTARIERFLEKPTWGQVFSDTINTGIFVLEPEIFDYIAADRPVDFSSEVFPALLEDGQAALRRRRRRLLGGRRHARGLRRGPQGRARRQGRRSTSPASS